MSKQHTPITLINYIVGKITDIRVQTYSGASHEAIEQLLYNLDLDISDKLNKVDDNHERLVEALEKMANAYGFNARIDARNNAKQLLTELKT